MKKIDVTQPYAMTSPFADGVFSSVSTSDFEIPADTSTAPDDTCVIDDGFLPITSTDLDDGGIAPERKNFNGMFYLSTDQRFFLQNGGFITYNSNVATAIGGYPQDAVLSFINSQGTYKLVKSLIDDNTNDFTQDETLIDGEHWEEIAMGGGGSGYQLFDIVMKDHVLTYEETLGLAQLGTYVYKEAIAGTRYGYPDYYAKVVAEYQDLNNTTDTVDSTTVTINANGHKFYDIADKATFDNMYTITGEAWYYGIDTTNERIFLPRSTRFRNGSTSDVGQYQEAGLPNITARAFRGDASNVAGIYSRADGSFTISELSSYGINTTTSSGYYKNLGFDASLSNPIYGASNTVEYSSTKLIPYMVVGNVANVSSAIDVVDVTTTENDTLPLGFSTYQGEGTQPSPAWLKSSGQWNSGEVYATFYNYYVAKIGDDFGAGKVVENTDPYTDYDLVINQTEQTFRLPLITSERVLVAKKEATNADPTWYNLYSDGWCEQGGITDIFTTNPISVNFTNNYTNTNYSLQFTPFGTNSRGYAITVSEKNLNNFKAICGSGTNTGVHDYPSGDCQVQWRACGYCSIPSLSAYTEPISLFYKVANAVQNLELLDAGEVLSAVEDIASTVENTVHIVDTYQNGSNWYRVWSDGWCEQSGVLSLSSSGTWYSVPLLKTYADSSYTVLVTGLGSSTGTFTLKAGDSTKNTANTLYIVSGSTNAAARWYTTGYLA